MVSKSNYSVLFNISNKNGNCTVQLFYYTLLKCVLVKILIFSKICLQNIMEYVWITLPDFNGIDIDYNNQKQFSATCREAAAGAAENCFWSL